MTVSTGSPALPPTSPSAARGIRSRSSRCRRGRDTPPSPCRPDADSYETQRDRFEEEALHLSTRLILSDEEACKTSIAEAARRELIWLAPRGRTVDIRIRRPDVTVTLAEAAEAAS